MGDGRDMQRGVGRPAGGGDNRAGVFQRLAGDDLARQRAAAFQDIHDQRAGPLADAAAAGIDPRDHRGIGHGKAQRLGNHRHGIGGELPGAGADGGLAGLFQLRQLILGHGARLHGANRLVSVQDRNILALEPPRQGRAAIDKDRGHVAADHAHDHTRQGLVAAAITDQAVIGMAVNHRLDAVGDDLAADQAEFHALVVHAHPVRDRDRGELARGSAGHRHAFLGIFDLVVMRHVAGRDLAFLADHPDHRLGDSRVIQPHGAHEGAVRRAVDAIGGDARAQVFGAGLGVRLLRIRWSGHDTPFREGWI